MIKFSKLLGFAKDSLNNARTIFNITNNNNEQDKAIHIFPYGLKSAPKDGDVFVAQNNYNNSNKVILGGIFKTKDINENEVLLYSQNNSILLKANGDVEVIANNLNIKVKGNVTIESPKIIAKGKLFVGGDNANFTPLCVEDLPNTIVATQSGPQPVTLSTPPQAKNMKLS